MFNFVSKSASVATGLIVAASSFAIVAIAPHAYATNTPTTCVDGSKRANLSVTWNANDSISFKTKDGKKLCNDVTLFFSSYTMPDNYDGKGFTNNPTASPQQIFDSKSFVMKKGTTGASTLKVKLPEACRNIQVDLYYAPEIKVVTSKGHGVQYITGKIFTKTADKCTPEEKPEEKPDVPKEEAQTPPTPAPEVTTPTPAPESLPVTGPSLAGPVAAAAGVSALGYGIALAINKRRQ